jgi:hypothetical protein
MENRNEMNAAITIDYEVKRRTLALQDACDTVRRASSAVAAAAYGEPDAMRFAVLEAVQKRLCSLLTQLKALT